MKLLESSRFEALNSALCFDAGQYQIIGRYGSLSLTNLRLIMATVITNVGKERESQRVKVRREKLFIGSL